MSILREDGEIELECDAINCKQGLGKAFAGDQFEEMISYARKKGWTITAEETTGKKKWVHYCPSHL